MKKKITLSKKIKLLISFFFIIGIGIGTWYFIGYYGKITNTGDKKENQVTKKKPLYICPMHPQIRSDRPGVCPICGMNLVLSEDEQSHEEQHQEKPKKSLADDEANDEITQRADPREKKEISISSKTKTSSYEKNNSNLKNLTEHTNFKLSFKKQQMIGIKLSRVKRKKLFKSIRAPGRIAFDPELYTAQSEYLEALKQWNRVKNSPISVVKENTKQMIHSSRIRLKVLGLSDDQIKALRERGFQSEGLLVSGQGQESWVYADIFEMDLPYIKKGLSAEIKANFLQGEVLPGKVISVDQVINPKTRTATVRIQLLKKDSSIRPESYVNITIFAPLGEHITAPLEAIMDTGRETFVFVKKGEGQFEPRRVSLLLETDDEVAIKTGLLPGEEIVVGGNFMLDSESRLKAVIQNQSFTGERGGGDHH